MSGNQRGGKHYKRNKKGNINQQIIEIDKQLPQYYAKIFKTFGSDSVVIQIPFNYFTDDSRLEYKFRQQKKYKAQLTGLTRRGKQKFLVREGNYCIIETRTYLFQQTDEKTYLESLKTDKPLPKIYLNTNFSNTQIYFQILHIYDKHEAQQLDLCKKDLSIDDKTELTKNIDKDKDISSQVVFFGEDDENAFDDEFDDIKDQLKNKKKPHVSGDEEEEDDDILNIQLKEDTYVNKAKFKKKTKQQKATEQKNKNIKQQQRTYEIPTDSDDDQEYYQQLETKKSIEEDSENIFEQQQIIKEELEESKDTYEQQEEEEDKEQPQIKYKYVAQFVSFEGKKQIKVKTVINEQDKILTIDITKKYKKYFLQQKDVDTYMIISKDVQQERYIIDDLLDDYVQLGEYNSDQDN